MNALYIEIQQFTHQTVASDFLTYAFPSSLKNEKAQGWIFAKVQWDKNQSSISHNSSIDG